MSNVLLKLLKKKSGGSQEEVQQFGFRISLHLLRMHFVRLDADATTEDIARILELTFLICLAPFFSRMLRAITFRLCI
jgi:hypothetical protein